MNLKRYRQGVNLLMAFVVSIVGCSSIIDDSLVINGDLKLDIGVEEIPPSTENFPVLGAIGDRSVNVGDHLEIQIMATSPDDSPLSYSLRSTAPDDARFDENIGLFEWTPTEEFADQSVILTFEVSNQNGSDRETIVISVIPEGIVPQEPPIAEDFGDHILTVGVEWQKELIATDPNDDPLTFQLQDPNDPEAELSIPQGIDISEQGIVSWTPTEDQVGDHQIKFYISDPFETVELNSSLSVVLPGDPGSNLPPVWTEPQMQTLVVNERFTLQLIAEDPEMERISFLSETLPMGSTLSDDGLFEWTPTASFANQTIEVIIQASDGILTRSQLLLLRVIPQARNCGTDLEPDISETFPLYPEQTVENRLLCNQNDQDLYELILDEGSRIEIFTEFTHDLGDIDIRLFDIDGEPLLRGLSTDDNELLRTFKLDAGSYLLEVKLFTRGPASYNLVYQMIEDDPSCAPDEFEGDSDNNFPIRATQFPIARRENATICPGDRDVYRFEGQRGQELRITSSCESPCNEDSDSRLRAVLRGPQHEQIHSEEWIDDTATNTDISISTILPSSGEYHLTLAPYRNFDLSFSYDLTYNLLPILACTSDQFEASAGNDTPDRASTLSPNTLYRNLSSCADPNDWYQVSLGANTDGVKVYIAYNQLMNRPKIESLDESQNRILIPTQSTNPTNCGSQMPQCVLARIPRQSATNLKFAVYSPSPPLDYELKVVLGL